jgi:hypothetical protein
VSARREAEEALTDADADGRSHWHQAYALTGIGWALLHLADAIRESREPKTLSGLCVCSAYAEPHPPEFRCPVPDGGAS